MKRTLMASMAAAVALTASDADLEALKAQLRKQQEVIEKLSHRVEELEKRDLQKQKEELGDAKHHEHHEVTAAVAHGLERFKPHLALIANMSAVARDLANDDFEKAVMPGFTDAPGEIPFNPRRGFNANYAELDIGAEIGGGYEIDSAFHIEPDGLAIGELYVKNEALPYRLGLKAGRYRSGFGLINAYHHHAWSFTSMPLVYESYFGPEGMADEGVQVQWRPQDGTTLGVEALQGSNEMSFGDTDGVNLGVAYLKQTFAPGDAVALQLGGTYMEGKRTDGRRTRIYGAELAARWRTGDESALRWRNEALWRDREGVGTQAGLYTELLYDFTHEWAAGARYDYLFDNVADNPDDLTRTTLMLHWLPFPSARLRLQYTCDRSKRVEGERTDIRELLLDLTIEAGAHHEH